MLSVSLHGLEEMRKFMLDEFNEKIKISQICKKAIAK